MLLLVASCCLLFSRTGSLSVFLFSNLHLSPWESTVPTWGPLWAIVAKTIIFWYLKTIIFWYLKAQKPLVISHLFKRLF